MKIHLFVFLIISPYLWSVEKPNVLLIMIDDLNDWVGSYSEHPGTLTPNLDRFAKSAVQFNNAHCQAPICGPSRAALLSGRYPYTTGVYNQPKKSKMHDDSQHFSGRMLPEVFMNHGYVTLGAGKISHGYDHLRLFQTYGSKQSFGPKPPKGKRFHYHLPKVPYTGTQTDWGVFPEDEQEMPDLKIANSAIEFLSESYDKPFFMGIGMMRPHVPFYVPQKWFDMHPLESIQLPKIDLEDFKDIPKISKQLHAVPKYPGWEFLLKNNNEQFKLCVQAYLACISFVDEQIGKVLKALEQSKHAENTIVVIASDHGYHLGEKGRVSKQSLWRESTRIPFYIKLPKQSQGFVVDEPVGLIDVYPSLLSLCGLPKDESLDGLDLSPLILQRPTSWRHAISSTYARGNHSLSSKQHHYIVYEDGSEELYDIKVDPDCFQNLASSQELEPVLNKFRSLNPGKGAVYHPAVGTGPINEWFKVHYEKEF